MAEGRAEEMYRLYREGLSLAEVGRHYHITRERVRQIFRDAGLPTRSRGESGPKRRQDGTSKGKKLVERLRATGDLEFVAAEFGLSEATARRTVRKLAPELLTPEPGSQRVPNGYWTKDRVIEAIQSWADLYGEPPAATDWNAAQAKKLGHEDRVARFREGLWPTVNTVMYRFGGWNEAIRAAGFEPTPVSSYGRPGDDPEVVGRAVQYYREGDAVGTAAKKAGVSVGRLTKALIEAGVPLPGERLVERIKAFLRGRNWTPAKTITYALPDAPMHVYETLIELRRDPELEFMEMAGRGVYVRLRP